MSPLAAHGLGGLDFISHSSGEQMGGPPCPPSGGSSEKCLPAPPLSGRERGIHLLSLLTPLPSSKPPKPGTSTQEEEEVLSPQGHPQLPDPPALPSSGPRGSGGPRRWRGHGANKRGRDPAAPRKGSGRSREIPE